MVSKNSSLDFDVIVGWSTESTGRAVCSSREGSREGCSIDCSPLFSTSVRSWGGARGGKGVLWCETSFFCWFSLKIFAKCLKKNY